MIALNVGDVDALIEEAERQTREVDEILAALSPEASSWRPNEQKWSALGHVAHMCLVNDPYLAVIRERIAAARGRGGPTSDGPYRHPRVSRWFARSMEPPPKRRMRTMAAMAPDPALDSHDVLGAFRSTQGDLVGAIRDARGLDLGRIRFGSPFMALLRFSLGTGFATLLAHNRRHVWLIREVLGWDGHPGRWGSTVRGVNRCGAGG